MPKIGAHVSASGGLLKAIVRAKDIGAECLQLFISSPLQWAKVSYSAEQMASFREAASKENLTPVFFHAIYLINLATEKKELLEQSKDSLIYYLNHCPPLGSSGAIFHVGSHKGKGLDSAFEQVIHSIREILKQSDPASTLVIENSAGSGGTIGGKLTDISRILEAVGSERLKVCFDTQHAFASGYDWRADEGYDQALQELEHSIGFDRLVAIHTNDSKVECGAARDRHENIGEGEIGRAVFQRLLTDRRLMGLPFILEVPGFDEHGPDAKNIELLKTLRGAA